MPAAPPTPTPDIRPGGYTAYTEPPLGDITHLFLNSSSQADIYSRGQGYTSNTLSSTINGPATIDLEIKGKKFPIRLTIYDYDTIGLTTSTTDIDLGPSSPSDFYSLAANHDCTAIAIRRRF